MYYGPGNSKLSAWVEMATTLLSVFQVCSDFTMTIQWCGSGSSWLWLQWLETLWLSISGSRAPGLALASGPQYYFVTLSSSVLLLPPVSLYSISTCDPTCLRPDWIPQFTQPPSYTSTMEPGFSASVSKYLLKCPPCDRHSTPSTRQVVPASTTVGRSKWQAGHRDTKMVERNMEK